MPAAIFLSTHRMIVLSSYPLSTQQNSQIAAAVASAGGIFYPALEERDEIIAQINARIGEATIFLGGRLTQEQWERAANLQWIHVPWAGVNALAAIPGFTERDILITNSSGVMADSVADQALCYMLMLNRSIPKQILAQQRKEWQRYQSVEHPDRKILRGKRLGILGYGAIGHAIALRARAFGMSVVATRRTQGKTPPELEALYLPEEIATLLSESDFVVVTLPLTPDTEGMLGLEQFRQMKSQACFINIARGQIVREEELVQALQQGTIAGAALDVFAEEPLPETSPLWEMPNVIVTPHSSGGYVGFREAVTALFLDNLGRFLGGQPMIHVIDTARGY